MKIQQELLKQTKGRLLQKIWSLNLYCSKLKMILIEYKATILIQQRQLTLQRKKLDFWEKAKNKRTYNYIGSRHNRDIGTLRRASAKRRSTQI